MKKLHMAAKYIQTCWHQYDSQSKSSVEQFFYYDAEAYTGTEEETRYSKLSETQEAQFHERHCIYEYRNL
jgi:hypothetical protein